MLVKEYKNPDTLSGPSLPCFPLSGHKKGGKAIPAFLIIVKYPFPSICLPGAKFLNLRNRFFPAREGR